ncbi:ATP-grasp domain-containing protein [Hippea jasoniae]|uniref:ATP-grasp domain-containing protein n=1 Tax=Hippea jasoniae TaxID=944479 RepID=UPI000555ECFD|nr:ATP-grasp domain-containing protein [Hippea jasoniae]
MEKIKVLITSAGRRVSLVNNFKKHAIVYCCDNIPEFSAACHIADFSFKVPPVNSTDYINTLLDICKKEGINIVVPTIDPELPVLAKFKKDFEHEGISIAISEESLCDTFSLKTKTYDFFKKNAFNTPEIIIDFLKAKYPLFAKLNNSSSSQGATIVINHQEAEILLLKNKEYVFQEFIEGQEYTVDMFFDRKGNLICAVPRERIKVRCGEVEKARTSKNPTILKEIKKLSKKLIGAYGVITTQLFLKNDEIYFIEINPRFGGGYPLSYLAGADMAKMLIDDFLGKNLTYTEEWKDNLIMLRYDAEVLVDGNSI